MGFWVSAAVVPTARTHKGEDRDLEGALIVILMVNPWREIDPAKSPFVTMFTLAGIAIAAHIVTLWC